MLFYWPKLHSLAIEKARTDFPDDFTFLYYHLICIHSLPAASVVLNVIISQARFVPSHGILICPLALSYCVANYLGVVYRGHPLYPFLTWTDYKSGLVVLGMMVISFLLFQAVTFLITLLRHSP